MASVLSYAIWSSLLKAGLARTPMTTLENNCMQSTASSAGCSTGGTLVSAFDACAADARLGDLYRRTRRDNGDTKRQMINIEQPASHQA